MPIGATIGGISAAVGVASGVNSLVNSGGTDQAAGASQDATDKAIAQQEKIRTDIKPYQDAGVAALGRISDPNKILENFQASPDYNFRLKQGMDAVGQDKAVNGLLRSGGALKALTGFAQNTAAGEFSNWWNRQRGFTDDALRAENAAAGVANNNANSLLLNGQNQGNAALAGANNQSTAFGGIADSIAKLGTSFGGIFGGGGGGGGGSGQTTGAEFGWT